MRTQVGCKCGEAHRQVSPAFGSTRERLLKGSSLQISPCLLSLLPFCRREKFRGLPPFIHSFIHLLVLQIIQRVPGTLLTLQVTQAATPCEPALGTGAAASALPTKAHLRSDAGVRLGSSLAGGGAADAEAGSSGAAVAAELAGVPAVRVTDGRGRRGWHPGREGMPGCLPHTRAVGTLSIL